MHYDRTDRISEEIKKELAQLIRELKDPRIPEFISIVSLRVTKDLKFAKVYVSTFGSNADTQGAVKGLNSAAGYIRREIGRRVEIRTVPEFTFVADDSIAYGAHISEILTDLERTEKE
ncbi:MAG: 30S ribosome-binding factor RbfA [Clostridia bacterium]|nr:30S ribosome-binding factor RbfA [Clostridia bacterium]